jgi:hypothetical protein
MVISCLFWAAAGQLAAAKVACIKTTDVQALAANHADWSLVMPERLTFSHFDSFILLQVKELLILGVVAGVWVVNNTSSVHNDSMLL